MSEGGFMKTVQILVADLTTFEEFAGKHGLVLQINERAMGDYARRNKLPR